MKIALLTFIFLMWQPLFSFALGSCPGVEDGVHVLSADHAEKFIGISKIAKSKAVILERYLKASSVSEAIADRSGNARFAFAAVKNEEILGFVVLERKNNSFQIIGIAVKEGHERQGVGKSLLSHVIEDAKSITAIDDVITIVAAPEMTDGVPFFENSGFKNSEFLPQSFSQTGGQLMRFKIDRNNGESPGVPAPMPQPQTKLERQPIAVAVRTLEVPAGQTLEQFDEVIRRSHEATEQ